MLTSERLQTNRTNSPISIALSLSQSKIQNDKSPSSQQQKLPKLPQFQIPASSHVKSPTDQETGTSEYQNQQTFSKVLSSADLSLLSQRNQDTQEKEVFLSNDFSSNCSCSSDGSFDIHDIWETREIDLMLRGINTQTWKDNNNKSINIFQLLKLRSGQFKTQRENLSSKQVVSKVKTLFSTLKTNRNKNNNKWESFQQYQEAFPFCDNQNYTKIEINSVLYQRFKEYFHQYKQIQQKKRTNQFILLKGEQRLLLKKKLTIDIFNETLRNKEKLINGMRKEKATSRRESKALEQTTKDLNRNNLGVLQTKKIPSHQNKTLNEQSSNALQNEYNFTSDQRGIFTDSKLINNKFLQNQMPVIKEGKSYSSQCIKENTSQTQQENKSIKLPSRISRLFQMKNQSKSPSKSNSPNIIKVTNEEYPSINARYLLDFSFRDENNSKPSETSLLPKLNLKEDLNKEPSSSSLEKSLSHKSFLPKVSSQPSLFEGQLLQNNKINGTNDFSINYSNKKEQLNNNSKYSASHFLANGNPSLFKTKLEMILNEKLKNPKMEEQKQIHSPSSISSSPYRVAFSTRNNPILDQQQSKNKSQRQPCSSPIKRNPQLKEQNQYYQKIEKDVDYPNQNAYFGYYSHNLINLQSSSSTNHNIAKNSPKNYQFQ